MGLIHKSSTKTKQNTIDPFSAEGIHQGVKNIPGRQAIEEGRKFSPNAGTGVVTLGQGIDTD